MINNRKVHFFQFKYQENNYLYDYNVGMIMVISDSLYNYLQKVLDENETEYGNGFSEEKNIVSNLTNSGLLFGKEDFEIEEVVNTAFLSFAPSHSCNFRCKYCFGEHGKIFLGKNRDFSKKALYETIDYWIKIAFPNAQQYRIDFVSGGEPLINFEIIKETVLYTEKKSKEIGKKISIWLCTNGSLLTKEKCDFLNAHNVSLGVSLDGNKLINDANRIDENGKGTYKKVTRNLEGIFNNKKYTNKFKNIWGLSVITEENIDFSSILQHHKKIGFKNIQMKFVRKKNEHFDVMSVKKEYEKFSEFLFDKFKNNRLEYFFLILNNTDYFGKVLKSIIINETCRRRCQAGTNKITVCPDGTIYPCDSFVGNSKFCMGNINEKKKVISDISEATVENRQKCKTCSIKYICGGDCYYNSYLNNETIMEPDEIFCDIQKHIVKICIVLCFKMQKHDEKLYKRMYKELKIKNEFFKRY